MDEEKKEGEKSCCTDKGSCGGCCGCKIAIAIILFLLGGVIGYLKGMNACKCNRGFMHMGARMPELALPAPATTPPGARGK